MSEVSKFLGHKVGEIISLTSLNIIMEHEVTELNMKISEVREYKTEDGNLNYTGYVCSPESDDEAPYMLLVRQVGDVWDMLLTYLQVHGSIEQAGEVVLTEEGDDLTDEFYIPITDVNGNEEDVMWTQKDSGTIFGVLIDDEIKTTAEYQTSSDVGGYQHGFLEWTGDDAVGYVEFWIGMPISEHDVKFLSGEIL